MRLSCVVGRQCGPGIAPPSGTSVPSAHAWIIRMASSPVLTCVGLCEGLEMSGAAGGCHRPRLHVIPRLRPGLDPPAVFEQPVRLEHRGNAYLELLAHLAHGRDALPDAQRARVDQPRHAVGDLLVKRVGGCLNRGHAYAAQRYSLPGP